MVVLGGGAVSCERGTPERCEVCALKCELEGLGLMLQASSLRIKGVGSSVSRNVKRFRGGLVFNAHRLVYHSTVGLRVIKRRKVQCLGFRVQGFFLYK